MEDLCTAKSRPRDRIVDTAQDLFRKHGISGIGVDAIAEAAGTNKMTLYRHFGSKDELIAACLRDIASRAKVMWDRARGGVPGRPDRAAACLGARRRRDASSPKGAAATSPMRRSSFRRPIIPPAR